MAYSSSMHLTIFGQTILLAVIHANCKQSDFSPYPFVRIKPKIFEQESLTTYQTNRQFIPTYPMPDMSGTVFHQPLNILNYKPIVNSAIILTEKLVENQSVPVVHGRLEESFTSKITTSAVKVIKTEVTSMTSLLCLNSLSSIFNFLPINSSRLRGFCN